MHTTIRSRPSATNTTTERPDGPPPALVIYASYEPSDVGRRIELTDEVTIGRGDHNTIVIDAGTVSRSHARIWSRGRAWVLSDLGSANGTYLRDAPVDEATLRPNDLFKVGPCVFKFLAGDVEAAYHEVIHQLAVTDGLTRVANRRAFEEAMDAEFRRASRYNRPLSLLMFDLDHFKRVNDTFGHMAGDMVLAGTAARVKGTARAEDVVARYGGEEFAVILPETPLAAAVALAEKLRAAVQGELFVSEDQVIPVTISIGAAERDSTMREWQQLVRAADAKLYEAKQAGRNRVVS